MKNKVLLLLLSCSLAGFTHAATQGSLGPTSQGVVNLELQILSPQIAPQPDIQITGLDDFNWGAFQTISDSELVDPPPLSDNNVCVYMTQPGLYSIEFSSANGLGSLEMSHFGSISTRASYSATFTDGLGTSFTTSLNGGSSGGLTPSSSTDCTNTNEFASITIDPSAQFGLHLNDVFVLESAIYSDSLFITVTPE